MGKNKTLFSIEIISFMIICCSGYSLFMRSRIFMIGIFAVAVILKNLNGTKWKIQKSAIGILLIAFILFLVMQTPFSYNLSESLKYIYIYFGILMLILMPNKEKFISCSVNWIEKICKIIASTIILNMLIPNVFRDYLYFLISGGRSAVPRLTKEISEHIYSGIMGEKGEAAFMMVIAIILILGRCTGENKMKKKDKIWLCIFLLALLLPAKRMLFAIGIAICLLYIIFWTRGTKKIKMLAGFCLIGIIGLMIVFSMPAFDTLLNRFLTYSGDDTANGRTYLWAYALEMFHKKSLWGYGYGSFNKYASERGVILTESREWVSQAHNIYLQLLGETGIIGTVIFLTISIYGIYLFYCLYKQRKIMDNKDRDILFLGGNIQVLTLVYGISGNIIYYSNQVMVYFFGISMMIYLQHKYLVLHKRQRIY